MLHFNRCPLTARYLAACLSQAAFGSKAYVQAQVSEFTGQPLPDAQTGEGGEAAAMGGDAAATGEADEPGNAEAAAAPTAAPVAAAADAAAPHLAPHAMAAWRGAEHELAVGMGCGQGGRALSSECLAVSAFDEAGRHEAEARKGNVRRYSVARRASIARDVRVAASSTRLFDYHKISGALTHLQLCIVLARKHNADVSEGEAAVEELQGLIKQKINALTRLAPAALDAQQDSRRPHLLLHKSVLPIVHTNRDTYCQANRLYLP